MVVLAPIRRIVWTFDQTEFVVVYFPCVVALHAQLNSWPLAWLKIARLCRPHKKEVHHNVIHLCTCAFLLLAHERSNSVFLFFNLIYISDYVADQQTLRRSTKWRVWPCGQYKLFNRLWAKRDRQLRLLGVLHSDLPEWIRWHRHGTVVLVRCGTRRWAYQKSAIFRTVHSGARRICEPETNLSLSWRKFVTSSVLFSHEQVRGDPCTNQVQICLKNGNQVATWKTSKSGFSLKEKKKEQILAEVRSEIQKHELEAESDRRSIQELTGIIDSQRMEIDHTITRCEQSRRDQLLLQGEISAQSGSSWNLYQEYARHGRIAEKSRVKGRGTFKKKIGWRLWGSNFFLPGLECQESQHPWRQRSTQMLRLTTTTQGIRWLHHCTFKSENRVRACCMLITQKRKFVLRCTVNFSKYGETRQLDVTKAQI